MSEAIEGFWRRLRHTRMRDVVRGRIDGRLDWRRVLADAALPAPAADRVAQVVRKARLWKRERVDVARELVAHFQDGGDAGASAESLVELFGDVKQAAQLIRRAKRRCRPLWWQALWWVSRSIAGFVGVYVLMAIWLGGVKPKITTDYVAILNEPARAVAEEDRAWPLYVEALRLVYAEREKGFNGSWWQEWSDFSDEERFAWVQDRQPLIEKIRQAAAKPRLGVTVGPNEPYMRDYAELSGDVELAEPVANDSPDFSMIAILLPHVQDMRSMSILLREDARRAAQSNEAATATADLEAMLDVARHAGDAPFLVNGLVQIAIDGSAATTLAEIITEHPDLLSREQLKRLAHRFAVVNYKLPDWLKGERLMFHDIVQRVYSDDGAGDGFATAAGLRYSRNIMSLTLDNHYRQGASALFDSEFFARAASPALYWVAAPRKELLAKHEELIGLFLADTSTPLWRREQQGDRFYEGITDLEKEEPLRYNLINLLMPALGASREAVERANGRRDGVLIGLALELSRRENGEYPSSLDGLSPRWLPRLPVDRINGGPLGYTLVDGKPIVYSLGVDTDDDDGRLPGYMNDAENRRLGFSTTDRYRVGPPLTPEELVAERPYGYIGHDGDWVIWSLVEPRHVARDTEQKIAAE